MQVRDSVISVRRVCAAKWDQQIISDSLCVMNDCQIPPLWGKIDALKYLILSPIIKLHVICYFVVSDNLLMMMGKTH